MNPEQFCIWLEGLLAGQPQDKLDEPHMIAINNQLENVLAELSIKNNDEAKKDNNQNFRC
jgi:hypothetical protein